MKLQFSTTRHLVVDLAAIRWVNPEETKLIECPDPNPRFPSYHSKPVQESAGAGRTGSAHVEIGGQWKDVFPDAEVDDASRVVAPPTPRSEERVAAPRTPEPDEQRAAPSKFKPEKPLLGTKKPRNHRGLLCHLAC